MNDLVDILFGGVSPGSLASTIQVNTNRLGNMLENTIVADMHWIVKNRTFIFGGSGKKISKFMQEKHSDHQKKRYGKLDDLDLVLFHRIALKQDSKYFSTNN